MAGTTSGGQIAARRIKEKFGADHYARIGAKGGKLGTTGGFGEGEAGKARARHYGAMGGTISRRKPNPNSARQLAITARAARKASKVL